LICFVGFVQPEHAEYQRKLYFIRGVALMMLCERRTIGRNNDIKNLLVVFSANLFYKYVEHPRHLWQPSSWQLLLYIFVHATFCIFSLVLVSVFLCSDSFLSTLHTIHIVFTFPLPQLPYLRIFIVPPSSRLLSSFLNVLPLTFPCFNQGLMRHSFTMDMKTVIPTLKEGKK